MNKITAIYTRVSSNEQAAEGYGLDSQEEKCRVYSSVVLGVDPENIELFVDDGYSAKNLKRPMLRSMLKQVREDKIERIIIYKLDRLTRNVVDTYALLKELVDLNCGLISVIDQLDISTANGRLVIGVLAIIAQWEREVNAERMRAAREVMVEKGIYPYGLPPYGWKKDENKQLIVDENKAAMVNLMGDMLIAGMCLSEIRRKMNEEYGLYFSKDIIAKYLKQEANIGIFRREGKLYTNIIPPIMSVEKYDEIQEFLKYREHHAPNKKAYIFHSLVYCAECEKRMKMVSTVKKLSSCERRMYYYYQCPECGTRVSQDKIKRPILLAMFMEGESDRINTRIKELKKDLVKTEKNEQNILNDFLEGTLSNDIFKKAIKDVMRRKESINVKLDCLKLGKPELLEESDSLAQYEVVHSMIKKIFVRDHIVTKIEYRKK